MSSMESLDSMIMNFRLFMFPANGPWIAASIASKMSLNDGFFLLKSRVDFLFLMAEFNSIIKGRGRHI